MAIDNSYSDDSFSFQKKPTQNQRQNRKKNQQKRGGFFLELKFCKLI